MLNWEYYLSVLMYLISCYLFSYMYKHLLLMVISLEFIMISVFYNMYLILMMIEMELFLVIMFLTVSVCEAALGLSLIVLMVRFYGNDYLKSLNLIKW